MRLAAILIASLLISVTFLPACRAEANPDGEFARDMAAFNSSDVEAGIALALKYITYGRLDLAEAVYIKMYEKKPRNYKLYETYGDFLIRQGRFNEAIDVLEAAHDLDIVSYKIETMLGFLYFRKQDYSKAARVYEKASQINRVYPEPLFFFGVCTALRGEESGPTKAFTLLQERFPTSPYAKLGWAVFAYYQGKFAEAVTKMDEIATMPDLPVFYYVLRAAIDIQLGAFDKAQEDLKKGAEVDPLGDGLLTNGAILQLLTKNNIEFEKSMKVAEKFEAFNELIMAKAYFLVDSGREDEAEPVLVELIRDRRNLFYASYLLGVINMRRIAKVQADKNIPEADRLNKVKELLDKAMDNLRDSVNAGKEYFPALFLLGKAQVMKGNYEEAIGNFEKALAVNPKDPEMLRNLGFCYFKLSRWGESRRIFEAILQRDEKDAYALSCLGFIAASTGILDEAIKLYKKAGEYDPNNAYIRDQIKRLLELEKIYRGADVKPNN
ncbi:MAG: tetratricopeptide repeat protein [Candidatus Brocadiia bacterium]